MVDERLEAIVRRVETLERETRRWRRAAVLLALGVVALVTMGLVPKGRIVEARRFVLKDAQGRVRVELGPAETDKSIALRFKDEAGTPRLTLGVEDETALLAVSDRTGRPRAALATLGFGSPGLTFYDGNGRARAELGLAREGEPSINLLDSRGGVAWKSP